MPHTILVTGASRGIGLELVRTLAAQGHTVIGTARKPDDASKIRAGGGTPELLDVDSEASIAALGQRLASRPIDVLVNNAGISKPCGSLADLKIEDAVTNFRVNAVSPMLVTRALLPSLRAGKRRTIVHISSIMGSIGNTLSGTTGGGSYNYRSSKAALNMMNACLAGELGPEGFACVVMHPGWVQTDMGGAGAPLTVQDSAEGMMARFDELTLAHTGAFLNWRGGEYAW